MTVHANLLGTPGATLLGPDDEPRAQLAAGADPTVVAACHPASSRAWAELAERSLAAGRTIEAYAYARVGYHRGLDALRRAGWRGTGPVPFAHEPNRGFLRCLRVLGLAAGAIGEDIERDRCAQFLQDCDPQAPALS